jgi:hypothetical protein
MARLQRLFLFPYALGVGLLLHQLQVDVSPGEHAFSAKFSCVLISARRIATRSHPFEGSCLFASAFSPPSVRLKKSLTSSPNDGKRNRWKNRRQFRGELLAALPLPDLMAMCCGGNGQDVSVAVGDEPYLLA